MGIKYVKSCSCKNTTATLNDIRFNQKKEDEKYLISINLYPGPSCDNCGKPWDLDIRKETQKETK